MNETVFKRWLDAYGRAWEGRNPRAAAELYAEDGAYQVTPFLDPLSGRRAILDYWTEVANTESEISFRYEILALTVEFGIAHWEASFIRASPDLPTKLDGIFVIQLNAEEKCISLREWWHKRQ